MIFVQQNQRLSHCVSSTKNQRITTKIQKTSRLKLCKYVLAWMYLYT